MAAFDCDDLTHNSDPPVDHIKRFLRFRGTTSEHLEIQALEVPDRGDYTKNKYAYATHDQAVALISKADAEKWPLLYFLPNGLKDEVSSRAEPGKWHNQKGKGKGDSASGTSNNDFADWRVFYVDVDYKRAKGTSATDEELQATFEVGSPGTELEFAL